MQRSHRIIVHLSTLNMSPKVKSPNIDAFFLDGGGSAMQHSYVQIAVCGPSRSSMLTGRRPDTTHVGTGKGGWCWCQRTDCNEVALFTTLPTYLREHGYVTAGGGKLFHPDACNMYGAAWDHQAGDDPRAWTLPYFSETNNTQIQWGSIPGPHDPVYNGTMGRSFLESDLTDGECSDVCGQWLTTCRDILCHVYGHLVPEFVLMVFFGGGRMGSRVPCRVHCRVH
jgi:hypothetical protein